MSLLDNISGLTLRSTKGLYKGRVTPSAAPVLAANFLANLLDTMDRTPERKRVGTGPGQYGHYAHVSSLVGACTRMHALAAGDDRTIMESVTGGHRVMWAIGRYVEKHIRAQYLKATNYQRAFGHWTCVCGKARHTGLHPHNHVCDKCGHPLDVYGEYTLYDHQNWIVGNPDLLIYLDGWVIVAEIKSMASSMFNELTQPKGDHIFQVSNYHDMAEAEGFKVHPTSIVIYCTKDFKHGSPYKEYHVDTTKALVRNMTDDARRQGAALRRVREGGALPPRVMCANHSTTTAKNCPFVVQCFSRS